MNYTIEKRQHRGKPVLFLPVLSKNGIGYLYNFLKQFEGENEKYNRIRNHSVLYYSQKITQCLKQGQCCSKSRGGMKDEKENGMAHDPDFDPVLLDGI